MKTTKSQKERVISGQHIQYLRDKKHHLSVTEFASLCTELVQREIPYSDSTVHAWEQGRRPLSNILAYKLAILWGVSVEYLLGRSSDMYGEKGYDKDDLSSEELSYEQLAEYCDLPVYVSFKDMSHKDVWAILVSIGGAYMLLTKYAPIGIDKKTIENYRIFPRSLDEVNEKLQSSRNRLGIIQIMDSTKPVYVVMNTTDSEIRARYNGWYSLSKNKQFLQSSSGDILPISGATISFNVYAEGNA